MSSSSTLTTLVRHLVLLLSFLYAFASPGSPTDIAVRKCDSLVGALPGRVFRRDEADYTASIDVFWAMQAREVKPVCIVQPRTADDVSLAVKLLTGNVEDNDEKQKNGDGPKDSKGDKVRFAIRGGGHMWWPGSSSIDGGVLFDLQKLDSIEVNKAEGIARVGSGQRWGNVYRAVEAEGLMVVGGRGSDIGVAGLTTGGGVSFFIGRKGFACDNIANYEIVLGSGRIANVNVTTNPDLFKALKGGSNNFGIITRFDMYAFESGPILGGSLVYGEAAGLPMLNAFTDAMEAKPYDPNAALCTATSWLPSMGHVTSANLEYTAPVEGTPKILQPFLEAPALYTNSLGNRNMSDLTDEFMLHIGPGGRNYYVTNTFKLSREFLHDFYAHFKESVAPLSNIDGIVVSITYQALHTATVVPLSEARGGNVLGFSKDDGPLVFLLLSPRWNNAADDEQVDKYIRKLNKWIDTETRKRGLYHPWRYLNYAAPWQEVIEGYGKESRKFLKDTSRKYDPSQIFQKQVPGGWKLK